MYVCVNLACGLFASIDKPEALLCPRCGWTLVMRPHQLPSAPPPRPTGLRIGHMWYTVIWDRGEMDRLCVERSSEYAGLSVGHKQTIHMDPDMGPDFERETVVHEAFHQCLVVAGVQPDTDAAAGVKDIEERTIRALAGVFLGVLRDNPHLLPYLLHQENPA